MPGRHRDLEAAQRATVEALGAGRIFGLDEQSVERVTTHAAELFLVGERAFKMKRAVRYSFLDFTSLDARKRALDAELELNRRTAPMLYRRLVPVTRAADGRLALAGAGEIVEWLLEMRRFDQDALLDRMAQRGELDARVVEQLAGEIAGFHERAAPRAECRGHAGMEEVIDGNAADFETVPETALPPGQVERLNARCARELVRRRALLEERRLSGRVRLCHGDLHLGNVVLLEGRPVLFDCLEFDERLASIDTMYDLAFLLMDLEHRALAPLAQRLLNQYLDVTWDDAGVALLPLFLACRAAIRAKVLGLQLAAKSPPADAAPVVAEAREYLERALGYLEPASPRLIAIGGVSGTGKSTLARRLAPGLGPAPGAVVVRSDVVRKRLHGVAPSEPLPPEAYSRERTHEVYSRLAGRAGTLVRAGHAAIVDAVFLDPAEREQIEGVAREASVDFSGLWLSAAEEVLVRRVGARRGDASDATAEVLRAQGAIDPGIITWRKVDATGAIDAVLADARRRLERT